MEKKKRILVIEDEAGIRKIITRYLEKAGYDYTEAETGEAAIKKIRKNNVDLVTLDYTLPGGMTGLDILKKIKREAPDLPVIMVTGNGEVKVAVEAVRAGAYDYVTKPFDSRQLVLVIGRALEKSTLQNEVKSLRQKLEATGQGALRMLGSSKALESVREKIKKVAPTDFTVLVQGESGTGKEVAAHLLHQLSARSEKPFIHVDCGIIPDNLIESELFGHERGAFTGADAAKPGQFELADGGTVFLDEIGNLPYPVQGKLLRILQSRTLRRLGGSEDKTVDVRIIAATNEQLEGRIRDNAGFRGDLYYRLSEFVIMVPPLRNRTEDIPLLVNRFADDAAKELGKGTGEVSPAAMTRLLHYSWPGNVRELKNVVRNAVLMAAEKVLPDDLIIGAGTAGNGGNGNGGGGLTGLIPEEGSLKVIKRDIVSVVEKEVINRELKRRNGNKRQVAKALDIDYTTLFHKIKQYGLQYRGPEAVPVR